MIRAVLLMSALFALLPLYGYVGNDVDRLSPPQVPEKVKQEWVQMVEGSLTEVDPDTQIIRIETREGKEVEFRYNERTQVERGNEIVVGCFGPKNERSAKVQFRTVDGRNIAVKIELLPSGT